jgi:hypothetical protein
MEYTTFTGIIDMKLNFTKTVLAAAMLLGLGSRALAQTDLIVEENGVAPNYATIQAAVTAASSSVVDRIFVKNKAGNVPYLENVTISKSVTILPFDPDGVFYCHGSYTINPIPGGGEVTIIGMYNNSGSINSFASANFTTPTRVNLLGSTLIAGGINTSNQGFVTHVAGNVINGSVSTRTATITGNFVDGNITVNDVGGNVTGYPEDTLFIVGNRVTGSGGNVGNGYIIWSNDDDYFMIANNNVRHSTIGINCTAYKSGPGTNKIENNSIKKNGNVSGGAGIWFSNTILANTNLLVVNNSIFDENLTNSFTEFAVLFAATPATPSFVSLNFNVHRNWRDLFTNVSAASVSMTGNVAGGASYTHDNISGDCTAPECINLGSPSTDFTDLDLTRNNVGTAGGSYNFSNFWPNQSGGARVYLVKTPRTVVQSSTINAKADSFDR